MVSQRSLDDGDVVRHAKTFQAHPLDACDLGTRLIGASGMRIHRAGIADHRATADPEWQLGQRLRDVALRDQ